MILADTNSFLLVIIISVIVFLQHELSYCSQSAPSPSCLYLRGGVEFWQKLLTSLLFPVRSSLGGSVFHAGF